MNYARTLATQGGSEKEEMKNDESTIGNFISY